MVASWQQYGERRTRQEGRKTLRGEPATPRHACHGTRRTGQCRIEQNPAGKWPQTRTAGERAAESSKQLDGWAAMLQAIVRSRENPMLETWIIDEIRRREEERRRGDRPQLELPVPEPRWPPDSEPGGGRSEQGDKPPERGVVIIGM
jgi:hypothetical protein